MNFYIQESYKIKIQRQTVETYIPSCAKEKGEDFGPSREGRQNSQEDEKKFLQTKCLHAM